MADIKKHLNKIKNSLYGLDVRDSIHDGIDAVNKECEENVAQQNKLQSQFNQLVISSGNSNAEIVEARVKEDGTAYDKLGDRLDEVDSQLAHIENIKTVQDLKNMSLKLDTVIQTCGYYEANDGGANTYIVIPSKEYSYDIECGNYAIRPIATSDTVCPKQFGTVNDGVNGDNEWLQACFDFVRDYNIGVIDGRNLLYTTDSSTTTYHNHYGVVIHQPVTLRNYRGQVKDDIGNLTSVIDILQVENDFREYLIENCEFNGKYGTVAQSTIGTEDGGRHCICFYGEKSRFPKEFIPMGNITIRNCRFIKPDAYGIFISPADCIYTVENCTFDTNGPCILSYATTMIAKNCTATINSSYKTMVLNFLHDEMEMASDYQGTKLKSFYVDNCKTNAGCIIKTHNSVQGALSYDKIFISNSRTGTISSTLLEMYQANHTKETFVNNINIKNCRGSVFVTGFNIEQITIDNDGVDEMGFIRLASKVNTIKVNNYNFGTSKYISVEDNANFYGYVDNFYLYNSKALEIHDDYWDAIGTPSSNRDRILNLYIDNLTIGTNYRIIEIGIENIYCNNIHVLQEAGTFDFIYNRHSQGCKKCIVKNSVFEAPTNTYGYLLQNKIASTGEFMLINCVYKTRLSNSLNGMTRKNINLIKLDDVE